MRVSTTRHQINDHDILIAHLTSQVADNRIERNHLQRGCASYCHREDQQRPDTQNEPCTHDY